MIRREVHLPAGTERVWEALTDPDTVAAWFGASVDWDLRPGGSAHFDGDDGARDGTVEEVVPGRSLRFVWWPSDDRDDASEVAYRLDGDEDGTVLTVTERRVPVPAARWGAADEAAWRAWSASACLPVGTR